MEALAMIEDSGNSPHTMILEKIVERCFPEGNQNYFHLDLNILKRISIKYHLGLH